MIAGSNIDDVRARIMALENAEMFDAMAWSQVLADLAAAGRLSALADAERRMETARGNQSLIGIDAATGQDSTVISLRKNGKMELVVNALITKAVSVETDKDRRVRNSNALLKVIAECGRGFFKHCNRISRFELDKQGRVWFVDAYLEARIYTHYVHGHWRGFSEGGTLRDLVIRLRDYITKGTTIGRALGPYPNWYCEGDPWGYGADMQRVFYAAMQMGIVEAPADLREIHRVANTAKVEA